MKKKVNYLAIFAVVMSLLFVGVLIHDFVESDKEVIPEGYISQEDADAQTNKAVLEVTNEKDAIISNMTTKVTEAVETIKEKSAEKTFLGYLIDKIYYHCLNQHINEVLFFPYHPSITIGVETVIVVHQDYRCVLHLHFRT